MLSEPKMTLMVLTGFLKPCTFPIYDFWDYIEPDERIVWIVAPKKNGKRYIKKYGDFDPNFKPISNKGRPPVKRKIKHMDSLKTCLYFLVKSLDPKKKDNHTYGIKLDCTNGQLNITGITSMVNNYTDFDPYVKDTLKYFTDYINYYGDFGAEMILDLNRFATLNFKSVLLNGKEFDRNNIYTHVNNLLSRYQETSFECLKNYILTYINTGAADLSLLKCYHSIDIRIDPVYLVSKLPDLTKYNTLIKHSSSSFIKQLSLEYSEVVYDKLYKKLMFHLANKIKTVIPRRTSKGGTTIIFNMGTYKNKVVYKKVNIYKKGYNSYCNTLKQIYHVHELVKNMILDDEDQFFVSKNIVFNLEL